MPRAHTHLVRAAAVSAVVALSAAGCSAADPENDPWEQVDGGAVEALEPDPTTAPTSPSPAPSPTDEPELVEEPAPVDPTVEQPAVEPVSEADPEPREDDSPSRGGTRDPEPSAPEPTTPAPTTPGGGSPTTGPGVDAGLTDPGALRTVPASGLKDGEVLQNARITGDMVVTGKDVTLKNVQVDGEIILRGSGATVTDSKVGALSVSGAAGVTISRVEISGASGKDGIHVTSDTGRVTDLVIEDSRIHSPAVTANSHYDGIQVRGVDGLTLRGNSFELGPHKPQLNAAIFLQEANGGNTNVTIDDNYVDGGGFTLYLAGKNVAITNNTFGPNGRWGLVYPKSDTSSVAFRGNVWAESGSKASLG
ncbi:right-handed parallel beta-helix repeat-containing protein [Actinotalea sp. BY-33]|uniref:Right-handed parallel beta-helix repeat-containing protein n=1 Tax=Actinotalea soli TaxID=2819234 RepID=A0A939LNY1_9CELL|nr:right-handed parallel beta-helix repeat-containing protein [Actinotalea soli]MBO1751992.1 right-handed parallel beta-helix repeat-containing protein [Actinotalea soli]